MHIIDDILRYQSLSIVGLEKNTGKTECLKYVLERIPLEHKHIAVTSIGIDGEILHTPSHSEDSISLLLDDGSCLVGDLEPLAYLAGYEENPALKSDWEQILNRHPKRILYAHANEQRL